MTGIGSRACYEHALDTCTAAARARTVVRVGDHHTAVDGGIFAGHERGARSGDVGRVP